MTRKWLVAGVLTLSLVFVSLGIGSLADARDQQEQQPTWTMPEYNAFQAAAKETNPQQRLKLLDDFVAQFPNSALMPYVDQSYWKTYNQLQNYPKVVEYADKFLGLGDKLKVLGNAGVQVQAKLETLVARCTAFEASVNAKDANAKEQLAKEQAAAQLGLNLLGQLPKPANMSEAQFAEGKKPGEAFFNNAAGFAALQLKDYKAAEQFFREALANNGKDALTYFRLGVAYLQDNPPQSMDGFWALARSIALKGPGEAQVRDYLRKQMLFYQQPGCDNLIDAQMNELVQLAGTAADRPANYTIPSAADLNQVRQKSNILSVLHDLQAGGDTAQTTWLAVCGSEFPEVVAKVIDVTPAPDAVILHVFTGATPDEMEKATTANEEVKIEGQPEAIRLQNGDGVRFSGTLVSYDPTPFLLHWDKCKVNPEDIPPEKPQPGRRRHRPMRRPGR